MNGAQRNTTNASAETYKIISFSAVRITTFRPLTSCSPAIMPPVMSTAPPMPQPSAPTTKVVLLMAE